MPDPTAARPPRHPVVASRFGTARGLGGILALALALRLTLFIGHANVDPWDDTSYLAALRALRTEPGFVPSDNGEPTSLTWHYISRPAFLLPVAFFQAALGPTELASALPSLLASLATLLLIYRMGCRLIGRPEALLATFLYALMPLDLVYATRILPESLQAFWLTLSVLAAVEATASGAARGRRLALYLGSGLALWLGYLTRATALLGLPIALLASRAAWRRPGERWEPLLILGVFLSGLGVESLYYLAQTGKPLTALFVQLAVTRMILQSHPEALFYPLPGLIVHSSYEFGGPHHLLKQLAGVLPHYPGVHLFSAFSPLGAAAATYAVARRRYGLLLAWLLGFLLYVQYGFVGLDWDETSSSLHYYLNAPLPRYLTSALPPLALLSSALLSSLGRKSRPAAAIAVSLVAATALGHAHGNYRFYRGSLQDMRQAAAVLVSNPSAPVYADPWGVEQLRFFSREKLSDLRSYPGSFEIPEGSLVIVGGSRGYDVPSEELARQLARPFHALHLNPQGAPPHWRPLFTASGPRHVSRRSDLVIFRVERALTRVSG